jgi:glycosyltransferase involved in cell wall biosynthesis
MQAVSTYGPGDVVVLEEAHPESMSSLERALPGWRVTAIAPRKRSRHLPTRVRWILRRDTPTTLAVMDVSDAIDHVAALLASDHRLLLASRSLPAIVASEVRRSIDVFVYDIEDAEDLKLARLAGERPSPAGWRRWWISTRDRIDIRAWRRFQQRLADSADLVTFCSESEQQRFTPDSKVAVIPNGTDRHDAVRPTRRGSQPVLFYVGQLAYEPNERAAIRLADAVLPLVRRSQPLAELVLVGAHGPAVSALGTIPGVTVLGFVGDLTDCWNNADVLVVPLRSGGGTRLKILEAMARRVPVVSTSIGAEGLDLVNGVHLLIADTDDDLAAAVIETISDLAATERRVREAADLVEDRYQWESIEQRLRAAIDGLVAERD